MVSGVSNTVLVEGISINVPVRYTESRAYMAFFPASIDRVNAVIQSKRVRPVSILGKKCLLGVTVFDYKKCDVGPYREIALSIPVLLDSSIRIPVIPLIFERMFSSLGFFALQLAITSTVARKHSEQIFGYPTYGNNISVDISSSDEKSSISTYDGQHLIAELSLRHGSKFKMKRSRYRTFFFKDTHINQVILEAATYETEVSRGAKDRITLGNHKISKLVENLILDDRPIRSIYYKNVVEVLQEPDDLGLR